MQYAQKCNVHETIGLEMVNGRYFSTSNSRDSVSAIMINETLAKMLEIDDPIGKKVRFTDFNYCKLNSS